MAKQKRKPTERKPTEWRDVQKIYFSPYNPYGNGLDSDMADKIANIPRPELTHALQSLSDHSIDEFVVVGARGLGKSSVKKFLKVENVVHVDLDLMDWHRKPNFGPVEITTDIQKVIIREETSLRPKWPEHFLIDHLDQIPQKHRIESMAILKSWIHEWFGPKPIIWLLAEVLDEASVPPSGIPCVQLRCFTADQITQYIKAASSWDPLTYPEDTVKQIHWYTRGYPRLVAYLLNSIWEARKRIDDTSPVRIDEIKINITYHGYSIDGIFHDFFSENQGAGLTSWIISCFSYLKIYAIEPDKLLELFLAKNPGSESQFHEVMHRLMDFGLISAYANKVEIAPLLVDLDIQVCKDLPFARYERRERKQYVTLTNAIKGIHLRSYESFRGR